jgi:hypothetical protein
MPRPPFARPLHHAGSGGYDRFLLTFSKLEGEERASCFETLVHFQGKSPPRRLEQPTPRQPRTPQGRGGAAARLRSRLRSRLVAPVLVAAPVGLLLRQCDRFCEAQDMHDLFCQMRDVCKPAGAKCPPPWRRTPPHLPARCLQGSGRANASQSAA